MTVRRLALLKVDGHVTTSRGGQRQAWYRLAPQRWNWRADGERESMVVATAQRLGELVGHMPTLRTTVRPSSAPEWGKRLTASAPRPLPGWSDHVGRCVAHLAGQDLTDKECYLSVNLSKRGRWWWPFGAAQAVVELEEIDTIVAGPGLEGTPATEHELQWLFHRSVMLGCPTTDELGDGEELVDRAYWSVEPFGQSVKVVADVNGEQVTRYVVVLTVGKMADQTLEEPWLAKMDRLGFPVEVTATLDVLPGEQVKKRAEKALLRIKYQVENYEEHQLPAPWSLQEQQERAQEVINEVHRDQLAERVDGWFRFAVSGETEAEALARSKKVIKLFSPAIKIVRPWAQYALAREFIPGEKLSSKAYRRRLPVLTAAAAQPAATATVGTRTGVYLGHTIGAGGKHVASWDLHRSMTVRERSGLTPIVGVPGSGKSTLVAALAYHATLAGIRTTILDPSGPLSALAQIDELRPYSKHVDLLSAKPGILNPWTVVLSPRRDNFATVREYEHACDMAAEQRRMLCVDVLMQFLPSALADQAETLIALRSAVRNVGNDRLASPRRVIEALRTASITQVDSIMARHSRVVADFLDDVAKAPAAQLVFPTGDPSLDYQAADDDDKVLTIITMKGLQIPKEGSDRRAWSSDEIFALPLLHLAAWSVQATMYRGDRHEPKLLGFDEVHALTRIASGRLLINTSARDSRKWRTRVLLSSQNAADLLEAGVSNLIDGAFVLRTEDPAHQREALNLIRVPVGVGYESALGTLSQQTRGAVGRSGRREAVWSDGEGGIERIVLDLGHLPDRVRRDIDTTPGVVVGA